jgi:hypothetical protein
MVVIAASLFLTISMAFLSITRVLINPLNIGLPKTVTVIYGENPLYIISQSRPDTIAKLEQYPKQVIYENIVNIFGNSNLSQEVTLIVNDREINKTRPDQDGRFWFYKVNFGLGENVIRIEQQEISDNKQYILVVKDSVSRRPSIISYHLANDTSQLDIMGIGEAASNYDLKLGGYNIPVETDDYGTFYRSINLDTIKRIASENRSQAISREERSNLLKELPPITLNRKIEIFPDSMGKYTRAELSVQLPVSCILYGINQPASFYKQDFR